MRLLSVLAVFAVVIVKISKANRCHKYGKTPANNHGEYFHNHHKYSVHKEQVISHDKANSTLVDKARVRIKSVLMQDHHP